MTALELLAPARNADIGIAAIRCGADAVYIGGPSFGARAAAGNSVEDIVRLCSYASRFGVRVFVTVNTLCKDDSERREAVDMMLSLRSKGVSAFIMQDMTLLPLLREHGPWKEEFHASTQCAIRTPERARFVASQGFSRLILERELSLGQIRAIHDAVPGVDLEFFVHGALCVCYSGDCYLSEALCGRSANRGECAQPCRSNYELVDSHGRVMVSSAPLLSLKDYCLIDRLGDLAAAGIMSFKIEGRLKGEGYVKNAVRAYSQALDELVASNPSEYRRSSYGRVSGGFTPDLGKTFNRGYTELFIDGKRESGACRHDASEGWHSLYAAKHIGEYVGAVVATDRSRYIDFSGACKTLLSNGDGLCTVDARGEVIGFRADKVELRRVFCKVPENLAPGTKIWRNRDAAFEKELEKDTLRQMRVSLSLTFGNDIGCESSACRMRVEAVREDALMYSCEYDCSQFEIAGNQDRMRDVLVSQLSKTTGDYAFRVDNVSDYAPLPFLPASYINGIRREIADYFASLPVVAESKACALHDNESGHATSEDLSHPRRNGELMRTKYCIRYRLGWCPKHNAGSSRNNLTSLRTPSSSMPLFLRNNGRLIPLIFDCKNCEMVLGDISKL